MEISLFTKYIFKKKNIIFNAILINFFLFLDEDEGDYNDLQLDDVAPIKRYSKKINFKLF